MGIGLVLFFMYVMLPQFIDHFQGFNVELPLPTRMLISISHVFTNIWWLLIARAAGLGALCCSNGSRPRPEGRRKLDEWKMKRAGVRQGDQIEFVRASLRARSARCCKTACRC